MPIDGLVSGLDTESIITQLMAAEKVPVDLMTARKTTAQSALDAYKSLATKLSAITTASAALERSTGWNVRSATTSDTAVATATASDGATVGGMQFTVDRLATTHGVATSLALSVAPKQSGFKTAGSVPTAELKFTKTTASPSWLNSRSPR